MDINARLLRAQEKQQLLRIERDIPQAGRIEGYVVGIGADWVLLATLDPGIFLDGFTALRIADIAIAGKHRARAVYRRALELHDEWPPSPPDGEIALEDTRSLLVSLGAGRPMVTIHCEREQPDACFIGTPAKVGRRKLHLREISTLAKWDDEPAKDSLKDITRVEFGGRYEQALFDVAGPPA